MGSLESRTYLHRAKSFIDVTVDRVARGVGATLVLVVIRVMGFSWPQLSLMTLVVVVVWLGVAYLARDGYISAIRTGLETRALKPAEVRVDVADLTTVEALLEELAHPDERRVLYAIDVLESLDKRNLVTPLLLYHESANVRARAVSVMSSGHASLPERWHPMIQRVVVDSNTKVRAEAIVALAKVRQQDATNLARDMLDETDTEPRVGISVAASFSPPAAMQTTSCRLRRLWDVSRPTCTRAPPIHVRMSPPRFER